MIEGLVILYAIGAVIVSLALSNLMHATHEDAFLVGIGWPAAACLFVVMGAAAVVCSPFIAGLWIMRTIRRERRN